jgi:hypothetical protein
MSLIQDAVAKLAVEALGRAITTETVGQFKHWVLQQAQAGVGQTANQYDDAVLSFVRDVVSPEMVKAVEGMVLRGLAEFARSTATPLDDIVVKAIARAEGIAV